MVSASVVRSLDSAWGCARKPLSELAISHTRASGNRFSLQALDDDHGHVVKKAIVSLGKLANTASLVGQLNAIFSVRNCPIIRIAPGGSPGIA